MLSRGSSSPKRTPVPRTTTSNPEQALDYVEELLYTTKLTDTTSDLIRPRAASGSALLEDELETSPEFASINAQKHVYGQPCPDHSQDCHCHHQLTQHCHIPWRHCVSALNAVKQSYRAGGKWIGAPDGWNKEHEPCLRSDKRCDIHAELQGVVLEKQKNKKYSEKPRARGRHSRGSGSRKSE